MPSRVEQQDVVLSAVDVFAGGGGLTVGLKRAGFRVVAAVENEPHAFSTYKANHPEVRGFKQDVRLVSGMVLRRCSPTGRIDLLSGCPPCQGLSSLTSPRKKADPRNRLIREMGRLVDEVRPRAVMMENVPGLAKKGKKLFDEFLLKLEGLGYVVRWDVLQIADYGVPQNRRRLVLLAGKGFTVEIPKPTHSRDGGMDLQTWRKLSDVIGEMPEPVTLSEANKKGGPQAFDWHIVRDITPDNMARLKHTAPGLGRRQLPDELRPDCHKGLDYGYNNVYGRMSWDQESVTITGGCTTFSKGRFGHPEKNRTISVREAALIQTFPPNYCLDTPYMDYACNIVGNALPCDFAEVLARQCAEALRSNQGRRARPRRMRRAAA
jgi:DNA (cytosine-5)-methyltransferase 1